VTQCSLVDIDVTEEPAVPNLRADDDGGGGGVDNFLPKRYQSTKIYDVTCQKAVMFPSNGCEILHPPTDY
jgi:hypothetical protein